MIILVFCFIANLFIVWRLTSFWLQLQVGQSNWLKKIMLQNPDWSNDKILFLSKYKNNHYLFIFFQVRKSLSFYIIMNITEQSSVQFPVALMFKFSKKFLLFSEKHWILTNYSQIKYTLVEYVVSTKIRPFSESRL